MRQALNQAAANRIKCDGKNDRNARCCLPENGNGAAVGHDDIGFTPLEFGGDLTDAIGSSGGPPMLDRYRVALGPAEFPQVRDQSGSPRPPHGRVRTEYSDEPLFPWLLRVGGQWPSANEPASDFDEVPPDESHFRHFREYQIAGLAI